ncbi:MAG: RDD family protein [Leptolyngbyaceae cyanobacterium SM2_3_12]|nr:RDD family protein [Leptolyngbyaceae cyanobacterium SM2_3_12]
MAQTSPRQSISAQVSTSRVQGLLSAQRSLAPRRLLAWGLEAGLLVSSVMLPWALGEMVRRHNLQPYTQEVDALATTVALNPVSSLVQTTLARPLGLSRQRRVTAVPPLTNGLWFSALLLPIVFAGSQLHGLAKTGKTWPKAWLGLQVVALDAPVPGYQAIIKRELVGRWGLPLGLAYGIWLGSGAFPGLPVLGALALAGCLGEGLTSPMNRSGRAWHDYLANTRVVLLRGGQLPTKHRPEPPTAVEVMNAVEGVSGAARGTLPLAPQQNF